MYPSQNVPTNLERHIKRIHPDLAEGIENEKKTQEKLATTKAKASSVLKFVKKQNINEDDVVMMIAGGGRAIDLVNDPYFQNILRRASPAESWSTYAINSENIRKAIIRTADKMKLDLIMDLKNRPINLCIDYASYHAHSFLGLIVQYLKNNVKFNKYLSCKEIFESHTAVYTKQVITDIFARYQVGHNQLMTGCTDTAPNVKASMRVCAEDFQADELSEIDKLTLEVVGDETIKKPQLNNSDDDVEETDEDEDDVDIENNSNFVDVCELESVDLSSVEELKRFVEEHGTFTEQECVAHIVQLAIETFLKGKEVSKLVSFARELAKYLRTPTMVGLLRRSHQKMALLPNDTRWSGVFTTVDRLIELKPFCTEHIVYYPELEVTSAKWKKFEQIRDILQPFKELTVLLQRPQLMVPDFVEKWYKIQSKLRKPVTPNPFCKRMLKAIATREKQIFKSKIIMCSMFFDKKFNALLNENQKQESRELIQKVNYKLFSIAFKASQPEVEFVSEVKEVDETESEPATPMNTSDEFLDEFLRERAQEVLQVDRQADAGDETQKNPTFAESWKQSQITLEKEIIKYELEFKIGREEKIHESWEKQRSDYPLLYPIVMEIFAAPITESICESVFSFVSNVFDRLRSCTKNDLLEALLFIYANNRLDKKNFQ